MKGSFILIVFLFFTIPLFSQTMIYTTSGNVIECQSVQKKRFGVEYLRVNSSDNYNEYLANTKIDRIEYANGDVDYISGSSNRTNNGKVRKDQKDFTYLSPHYISLNVGPSIPYGYFGYNPSGGNQGNAYTGVNVNFDATGFLYRGFGIGITGGYSYNPFQGSQHSFLVTGYLPPTATGVNITVGGWNNAYLMAGGGYFSEIGRFMLDYKGMIGAIFSYFPTANAIYIDSAGVGQNSIFTSNAIGLIYGIQGNIRYFLTRKIQLKGSISMMYGSANFSELTQSNYENGIWIKQPPRPALGIYYISCINITVGVAYTLGK